MTLVVMPSGPFAGRFWHRFGFFDHRKAWRRRPLPARAPSWRFSTRFGRTGGCPNLLQNAGHRATHLPRRDQTLFAFPRTQHGQTERFAHEQQITGTGYEPTPTFHLLWCAQMRLGPEQVLFEKAIAMLVREALAIPGTHLLQGHVLVASPNEPTDARVTFGLPGGVALYAYHTHLRLWSLAEMQVFPAGDHHPLALLIGAFPFGIGRSLRFGARPLKERAMFARRTTLLGLPRRRGAVQLAVALEPDQGRAVQLATGPHQAPDRVPAIGQHDHRARDERQHGAQLLDADADGALLATDAALVQHPHPTTGLLR